MKASRTTPAALAAWRQQMGYSQRDAARELGCSRVAWIGWERGDHPIPKYIGLACSALAMGMKPWGADTDADADAAERDADSEGDQQC